MTPLAMLPCRLVVRPHKGMSVNAFHYDIELDRIALSNLKARQRSRLFG